MPTLLLRSRPFLDGFQLGNDCKSEDCTTAGLSLGRRIDAPVPDLARSGLRSQLSGSRREGAPASWTRPPGEALLILGRSSCALSGHTV
jgi:hypothetical protein